MWGAGPVGLDMGVGAEPVGVWPLGWDTGAGSRWKMPLRRHLLWGPPGAVMLLGLLPAFSSSPVRPGGQIWKVGLWSPCAHKSPSQTGGGDETRGTKGP